MTPAECIVLLADELNRLAMAVESLAAITPLTEREYAKARRGEALKMAREARERVAVLIEPQNEGCPEMRWDGPYKFRCGLGAGGGVCSIHGPFEAGT